MTYLCLIVTEISDHILAFLSFSSTRLPSLPGRSSVQVLKDEQLVLIVEKEAVVLFARLSSTGVLNGV